MIQRIGRFLSAGGGAGALASLVFAAVLPAGNASAQCAISSGPYNVFSNPTWPAGFTAIGAYDAMAYSGGTRLYANANFGFGIYDISTNPAVPANLGWVSLVDLLGFHCGDGQTDISTSAISEDGNRLVVSMDQQACHGSNLVFIPGSPLFALKGDFGGARSQVVVQHAGSRYIAYALSPSANGFLDAADITNPPGWILTPGSTSPSKGNIASEQNQSFPGGSSFFLADGYLFYLTAAGGTIKVIDARNPGPAGSITAGYAATDIPLSAWGRVAGESISAFSAAVDPASGGSRIYVVAEFKNASQNSTGFTLLKLEGGGTTVVNTFLPPAPYSGPNSYPGGSVSLQSDATAGDINILLWVKSRAGAQPIQFVLYSTSVIGWSLGSTPLASSPVDGTVFGGGKMSVYKRSGTESDVYLADGYNTWAVKLACTPPNSPAASSLKVEPVPCPGGAQSCPLADGATVFLGDTLKITPSISPPDAFQAVNGWRLDYDFHAGSNEDAGSSYPRLAQPDASGSGSPAASYTLVGPCDPTAGGTPSSGSGCWNSVLTNGATGGPDFSGSETAGATKSLRIAFEANNALGSANKATQNLTWKVPAVRLATPAILAGGTIQDGSDGHPSATGFKWYFGTSPTSPPGEALALDAGCSGPGCTHAFPGPGKYNVWLTVPYPNGYTTPDCGSPCTAPVLGLTVKVTEVVPALRVAGLTTPPTVIPYSAGQVTIDDAGTQVASGVTIDHYLWCAVVAPATCDPAGSPTQRFNSVPALIPLPPIGNYNLFVKVYYTGGTASPADWTPNDPNASDPRAWRLNVVSAPPTIAFVSGVQPCFVGCTDVYTNLGTPVSAKVVVGGVDAGSPASQWSIVPSNGASPSSGNGATFAFTPTSATDLTLSLTDSGLTVQRTISVLNPTPLGVSVSASPNPTAPGTLVHFSASGTGGTGVYTQYSWAFGDGQSGTGQSINHSYTTAGDYVARCTVTDSSSATAGRNVAITIGSGGGGGPSGSVNFNVLLNGSPAGGGNTDVGFVAPAGTTLNFVPNTSYGSYDWNFGDGSAHSVLQYPTHVYVSGGTFTATLTTDTGSRSATITVTGGGIGTPDFRLTDVATAASIPLVNDAFTVFSGQQVRFTPVDAANGNQVFAGAVSWSFGDPGASTSSSNPALFTYNVSVDSTFTAQLTVIVGSKSVQHAVNVVRPVTGSYTFLYLDGSAPNVNKVDAGRPLAFTATEGWADSYDWDFGDGTPHGSGAAPIHAFPEVGTFTVVLTETRAGRAVSTPNPTVFSVQEAPLWVIPGLASVKQGQLPGSSYVSDVAINNPSPSQTARYQIAILDGKPLEWKAYTFFPNQTILFDNVVGKWFQRPDGAYALLVKSDESNPTPPVIAATTYNNNQGDSSKGTYGVALPVLRTSSALSSGASSLVSSLAGLRDVPKPPDGESLALLTSWPNVSAAYTNIGLVNTGTETAAVEVRFKTTTGDLLGEGLGSSFTTYVAPNQTVQFTRPLQNKAGVDVSANPVSSYVFSVNIASGAGLIPYASISDIGSSDPVFVSPRPQGPLSSSYRVPGVVRAAGANGTFFKSRFVLYNPSTSTEVRSVSLTYSVRACDPTGYCTPRVTVNGTETLRAGETKTWEDFVADWVTADPETLTRNFVSGWIDVAPADANTDPLVVRADTYNNQTTGNFGTQVPGFVPAQDGASAAGPNKRLVIPRVVQSGDPAVGYRTNLSFFLLSGTTATAKVTFFRRDGAPLEIDPLYFTLTGDDAFFQLNSSNAFWNQISPDMKAAGVSVVIEAVDGVLGAYASQVDNVSGDQTLVPGTPLP